MNWGGGGGEDILLYKTPKKRPKHGLPRLRHVPELLIACVKARRTWLLADIYSPFTRRRIN
jgi:hypothetical protein